MFAPLRRRSDVMLTSLNRKFGPDDVVGLESPAPTRMSYLVF